MYKFESLCTSKRTKRNSRKGYHPYPHNISITHTLDDVRNLMGERTKEELEGDSKIVNVAGRVMLKRKNGKSRICHPSGPKWNPTSVC